MIRKVFLPVLALVGVLFAVYMVRRGNAQVPASKPVVEPSSASYASSVAGSGLVEASTENIAIGTSVPGVVTQVFAKVDQPVKKGEPLFQVDDRELRAELAVRQAAVAAAKADLEKLLNQPRPEEIPIAEAKVAEAEALLENAKLTLSRWRRVEDPRSVSPEELRKARLDVKVNEAKLSQARADLTLLKAGAWKPDIEVARAQVASAEAQVAATRAMLDRLTVRAPVDGRVLQVKIRPGEFAPAGVLQTPLMLVGRTDVLHIRVDVDENEAWRVRDGAKATAAVRGKSDRKREVQFVRMEPYIVPKRSLTGDSTERVDTRVLQVLYKFNRADMPEVKVGQQMDVYIDAPPVSEAAATAPSTPRTSTSANAS